MPRPQPPPRHARLAQPARCACASSARGGRSASSSAPGHVPYAARVVAGPRGWARVVLVQTIAGPLAGDRAAIDVEVGAGRGARGHRQRGHARVPGAEPARHDVRAARRPSAGGSPGCREPLILAAGCNLEATRRARARRGRGRRHARARRARPPRRAARPLPLAAALRARRRAAPPRRGAATARRPRPVDLDGARRLRLARAARARRRSRPTRTSSPSPAPGRVLRALAPDAAAAAREARGGRGRVARTAWPGEAPARNERRVHPDRGAPL